MDEMHDDHDTPRPRRPDRGWNRWSQGLLESVFTTIAIGAVVVAIVVAIDTATASQLEHHVGLEDGAASAEPDRAGGYALEVRTATLIVEDPGVAQRLVTMLPGVLVAATVGTAATLLWLVARSLRDGDLFHPDNGRRLRQSANVVLVGGLAAAAADILGTLWFVGSADGLPVRLQAAGSLIAIPVALALAGVAEIFRRGAALRDDVEGLV